jgi:hypothetical protein
MWESRGDAGDGEDGRDGDGGWIVPTPTSSSTAFIQFTASNWYLYNLRDFERPSGCFCVVNVF